MHGSEEEFTEENRFLIRVDSPISLRGSTRRKAGRRNANGSATQSGAKLKRKIDVGGGDIHTIEEINTHIHGKEAYVSILDVDDSKDSKYLNIQDSKQSQRNKMLTKP